MSSLLGTLGVNLEASTAGFSGALDRVEAQIERTAESLDRLADRALNIGKQAAVAFVGLATPIAAMVKQAADAGETMNLLSVTFQDSTADVVAWSKATARAVGRSENELQRFAGAIGPIALRFSDTEAQAAEFSGTMAQLAVDMASFFNATDEEALNALRSGLLGEAEPLKRFNVFINEADLNATNFAKSLGKTTKEMTRAEAIQNRYNAILEQTQLAQGDAARTLGGFTNQMRAVRAQVADFAVEQGRLFLPIAQRIVAAVRRVLTAMSDLPERQKRISAAFRVLTLGALGATAALSVSVGVLGKVGSSLTSLGNAAVKTAAFLIPLALKLAAIAAAAAGIILIIGAVRKAWDADLGGMRTAVEDLLDAFDFATVKKFLNEQLDDLTEKVVTAVVFWREAFESLTSGTLFDGGFADRVAKEAGAIIAEINKAKEGDDGEGGLLDPTATKDALVGAAVNAGESLLSTFRTGLAELAGVLKGSLPTADAASFIQSIQESAEASLLALADKLGIGTGAAAEIPAGDGAGGAEGGAAAVEAAGFNASRVFKDVAKQAGTAGKVIEAASGPAGMGGALQALATDVLLQTDSFAILTDMSDEIVEALAGLLDIVAPLVEVFSKIVGSVIGKFSSIVSKATEGVRKGLDFVTGGLFDLGDAEDDAARSTRNFDRAMREASGNLEGALGDLVRDIAGFRGRIVPGQAAFTDLDPSIIGSLNERQLNDLATGIRQQLEELEDQAVLRMARGQDTGRIQQHIENLETALADVTMRADEMSDAIKETGNQLTNVPEFFKVAAAEAAAITPEDFAAPEPIAAAIGAGAPGAQSTADRLMTQFDALPRNFAEAMAQVMESTPQMRVEAMTVQTDTPDKFVEQVNRQGRWGGVVSGRKDRTPILPGGFVIRGGAIENPSP